jgi:hypothetical protein
MFTTQFLMIWLELNSSLINKPCKEVEGIKCNWVKELVISQVILITFINHRWLMHHHREDMEG